MSNTQQTETSRLETIRQEYVRLSQICTDISTDTRYFRYLGLIAVVIAWDPFVQAVNKGQSGSSLILFLGFSAVVILVGVISLQELVTWSHFWFYAQQLVVYEQELRKVLGTENPQLFRVWEKWQPHMQHNQIYPFFMLSVLLPVALIPIYIFYIEGVEWYYALGFFIICVVYLLLYVLAVRRLYLPENKSGNRNMG